MESKQTRTVVRQSNFDSFTVYDHDSELTRQRLDALLAINAETAREKNLFNSEREKTEAAMMKNPLSPEQTFAYFGLLLGSFPPAAMFLRFLIDSRGLRNDDIWILGIVAIVNIISAVVGYFSGKFIGKIVRELEKEPWLLMVCTLPFIGIFWGILAGGAGGIIIFVIGAFFGAILGGAVGGAALPAFAIFHRLLKKGDVVDRKHFLPLAFGITLIICGFILGL
ncbi:MAG: hypothetical protein H0V31_02080 [Acidobacteria bacterium]|nr:hypothetical protein [Acidobacteriota bacterium]